MLIKELNYKNWGGGGREIWLHQLTISATRWQNTDMKCHKTRHDAIQNFINKLSTANAKADLLNLCSC
jgi:hypothetical protein